jgi:hypothetical protein
MRVVATHIVAKPKSTIYAGFDILVKVYELSDGTYALEDESGSLPSLKPLDSDTFSEWAENYKIKYGSAV